MSLITQVRLAPITYRYMSASLKYRGFLERSTIFGPNSNKSFWRTCTNSTNNNKFESIHLSNNIHISPDSKFYYLTALKRKAFQEKQLNSENSWVKLTTLHSRSLVKSGHRSSELTQGFVDIHQVYSIKTLNDTLHTLKDYLLDRRWTRMKKIFESTYSYKIYRTLIGCDGIDPFMSSWKDRHENRKRWNWRDRRYCFNHRSLYTSLAILGLFSKPSEKDLEEERAMLIDEQKVKKMKPIELKIARGVLSMCDQEYSRADQLFHEALHIAQDENDEDRENLILNLIAANHFESGDLEKAERLFIDIMKRMIARDVSPTARPILELSLKLASIYSRNPGTHEKALKGFKFVINSLLQDLENIVNNIEELELHSLSDDKKDELALLGWSYDWFAKHLLAINDYSGAADMLQRAVQISSLVLGPLHDQTLILLNDIGTTLAMNDSPEEGKVFIKKAVEGAITSQSKELASFYVNLGLVNLKLMNLEEAKRYCEYSMELAKKNREHYNTQEILELSRTCLN